MKNNYNNNQGKISAFLIVSAVIHILFFAGLGYCRMQNDKKQSNKTESYAVLIAATPLSAVRTTIPSVKPNPQALTNSKTAKTKFQINPVLIKKKSSAFKTTDKTPPSPSFSAVTENYPKGVVSKRKPRSSVCDDSFNDGAKSPSASKPVATDEESAKDSRYISSEKTGTIGSSDGLKSPAIVSENDPINSSGGQSPFVSDTEPIRSAVPDVPDKSAVSNAGPELSAKAPERKQAFNREHVVRFREMVIRRIESGKAYPRDADEEKIHGTVSISFIISPDGNPSSIKVVETSGYKVLDDAAIESAQNAGPFLPFPDGLEKPILVKMKVHYRLSE